MIVEGRYLHKTFWLTYNLGQGEWKNRHAARRDVGRSPLLFFENWKKVPWFWKKMPRLYPSLGYVFHSKCSFEKKLQNFSLRCLFLFLVWWSAHQSAPIPWNLLCPEKFLVACLNKEEYRGKRSLGYKEKYTRKYTDKEFQKKEEIKIRYIQKRKDFCQQELEGEASRKIYRARFTHFRRTGNKWKRQQWANPRKKGNICQNSTNCRALLTRLKNWPRVPWTKYMGEIGGEQKTRNERIRRT